MCFSPEASFTASAVITTVGLIALKKAPNRNFKLLAFIPLFFGIQQFSEGFVWLSLLYEKFYFLKSLSTIGFIIFAWVVWPVWVPLSIQGIELDSARKKVIRWFLYLGIFVSGALAYTLIFRDVRAGILDCSIVYNFSVSQDAHMIFGILYLIVTVVPTLLSKVSKVWLLGVMNIVAYAGTKLFISDRILSIWCFFAAITSIIVLWIVLEAKKRAELS